VTTNIQLAGQIARHVQLKSIVLKSAHIESFLPPGDAPSAAVSISQQHRCDFEERALDDRREIHVITEFRCRASSEGKADDLVTLEATFILVYALPLEIKFEARCVKHFAELNGTYNAWPYWRELVQTATGRVGLSGILLPVYKPAAVQVTDEPNTSGASALQAPVEVNKT